MSQNAAGLDFIPVQLAARVLLIFAVSAAAALYAASPPNDNFASAQVIVGNSGRIAGSNVDATGEPGEPIHAYGASAHFTSVWYRWTPTENGVAIFEGSSPTSGLVLAVYSGSTLSSLRSQTGIGSYGSSPNSTARAAVRLAANTTYSIAVGSYYGSGGPFTLVWSVSEKPIPFFSDATYLTDSRGASSSTSLTISAGARAVFTSGYPLFPSTVAYQWNRDGVALAGASGSLPNQAGSFSLTIDRVQLGDAGAYSVKFTNSAGSFTSAPVTLAVVVPPPNDNFANALALAGASGTLTGTNVNATDELGEPAHWNAAGAASSVWYRWTAPTSGLATFDTNGSEIDTVLAVYSASALAGFAGLTPVATDDDHGTNAGASLVSFAATAGSTYHLAVGGATAAARGEFTLNWRTSANLAIAVPPASQTAAVGGSATFSVTVAGTGFSYQWNRNGVAIPGATSASLQLTGLTPGADASYTVTVTDRNGPVTSPPATLTVAAPTPYAFATRRSRAGAGQLWSIAASPASLVTVGDNGLILASTDGALTWTPRFSGTANWLVGVAYGAGRFVAVGDRGIILVSTDDGLTWRAVASSGGTQRLNNVIYAEGLFVAVGEAGTIITSPDAINWSPRISDVPGWLRGLAYHAQLRLFAVAGADGVFLTSPNGAIWERLDFRGLTANLEAAVAVDGFAHFVAIGSGGAVVSARQSNVVLKTGETVKFWSTRVGKTDTALTFRGLAQGASALFATGEGGSIVTATSDSGPWFPLPLSGTDPNQNFLGGLYYRDTLLVVGGGETILQSSPILASRLINLSTRGTGQMNCGFVVTGSRPKSVLVRVAGPSLSSVLGLAGAPSSTSVTLTDGSSRFVATNGSWSTVANASDIAAAAARVGAFPFRTGTGLNDDSAILVTLAPGAYVAAASGSGSGFILTEIYDADLLTNDTSRAINLSTRGIICGETATLIAGFVLEGAAARRVLIRGVGPGLRPFFVSNPVAETKLEVFNSRGLLHASATAWGLQPNADEIRGAFDAAGAFKLADGSKDSAMVLLLQPGLWTVQLSALNGAVGSAMVEVYMLP